VTILQDSVDISRAAPRRWLRLTQLLAEASTDDLQQGQWEFPRVDSSWAVRVQRSGRAKYGDDFSFLGFELNHFGYSDRASRERLPDGSLRFAAIPSLGDEFVIFSGSIERDLVRYRLDPSHRLQQIESPFAATVFENPDSRWYNIGSTEGAAKYFASNASRILDFFAVKICRNIDAGRRTLLITRKKFLGRVARYLEDRLKTLIAGPIEIVTSNWERADLRDPRVLPLVNYGISGVNLFEHIESAYCLTGYYISPSTLEKAVYDLDITDDRFPISIVTRQNPMQRRAHLELPHQRVTILPTIAQGMLEQKEADVVVQAIGRVRPFTRSREIITFQAGTLPGIKFNMVFPSVAGARSYFSVPTRRSAEHGERVAEARQLSEAGLAVNEIARELQLSPRTIRRYLR